MTPAVAAHRLWWAFVLGWAQGLWFGFLRPLGSRRPWLSDLLILAGAGFLWLELSFRICRGDLRLGYMAALLAGAAGWEAMMGPVLRPVFGGFWNILEKLWRIPQRLGKKISILEKFCLHLRKNGLQ